MPHHDRTRPAAGPSPSPLTTILLMLLLISLAMPAALRAATEVQIGPGVAGQLHALAYDPDDADHKTIYAGGDNFGVYRTVDHGQTWHPWNAGMEQDWPMRTSYVDDILVVPEDPSNPVLPSGIYAATFGGILYRGGEFDTWHHQTVDLVYHDGLMEDHGGAIPFACLAFDEQTNMLFAGAGRARKKSNYNQPIYPETGAQGEYSLWCKDLDASAGDPFEDWTPVQDIGTDGNVGTVRQIGIVTRPGRPSRLVLASSQGIYIQGPGRSGWQRIWDPEGLPASDWPGWSRNAWAVAVGGAGRLYAITTYLEDGSKPAVWWITPSSSGVDYQYGTNWNRLGISTEYKVLPQDQMRWSEILAADEADLYSLTVVPSESIDDEEVFVGMIGSRVKEYNGYFRYGTYRLASGQTDRNWVNFVHVDTRNGSSQDFFDFYYTDYSTDASESVTFDPGWLRQYWLMSTVPLIYHPDDHSRKFVAGFHIPLITGDGDAAAGTWTQRYCDLESGSPEQGYYASRGLNEMSPRSVAFTDLGEMVIGCGDFQAFLATDATGTAFRDMDPFYTGNSEGTDIEVLGDDIYVLRGAAGQYGGGVAGNSHSKHSFGFEVDVNDSSGYRSRQQHVIARFDPNLTELDGTDGFHWRFISRAFDGLPGVPQATDNVGPPYDVTDIEAVDDTTMFAALAWNDGGPAALVVKGTLSDGAWTWQPWWKPVPAVDERCRIVEMRHLPGSRRLLVVTDMATTTVVTIDVDHVEFPSAPYQTATTWLSHDDMSDHPDFGQTHRLTMSLLNLRTVQVDPTGRWVYLTSNGQHNRYQYEHWCANVLRVAVPEDGSVPAAEDWELLLNRHDNGIKTQGISFPSISGDYWPDSWGTALTKIAETLPRINALAIHPQNPRRVFIGIRAVTPATDESFHPFNGVWEFTPDEGVGQWNQIYPQGTNEPSKGVNVLAFLPDDSQRMVAGVFGQGFYRLEGVAPSPLPVSGVTALEAVHPDQELLMVSLQPDDSSVAVVWVDATAIGGNARLHLNDDGTDGDWVAGDGIWTATVAGFEVDSDATVALPVCVRDAEWNTFRGDVDVQVLAEEPAVYYRNDSDATGATFSGLPSGIAAVDLYETVDAGIDADRDIYVSALADELAGLDPGTILLHMGLVGDVPQYRDRSDERFPSDRPLQDHGPATAADLNGDGLPDLIVPDGSSDEGLLLFKQTSGQTYVRRDPWLGGLPSALQADTWSAACGDYDGDGQLDIYLCRSTASEATGLPGPGSGALADVLLRSDMANNKEFIVDSAALEVPLDGQEQPIHLATSAAAWCDFDGDGDLDLAIADGSTAKGVFIYRNDPDTGPTRFSIVYPTDPANAPWPRRVSGIAWVDVDGDGDLDLVATTHTDLTWSNECYVLLNQGLTAAGPFAEPQLLALIPAAHQCTGFRAMDHDLDGDQDLLLLPGNADAAPLLLLNDGSGTFASATSAPGLGAMKGGTNGALVADLNGDGRAELFLGRPEATGRFFGTAVRQQGGSDHWIALDLRDERLSGGETVQIPAVGAKVVVQCGPSRQTTMLVEANGRTDHVLRIGVEADHTPSCTVFWPSGHVTNHADLAAQEVNVLTAPATVDLQLDSVTGFTELKPGEVVDWVFRWTTDVQVDMARSRILFTEPLNCQLTVSEIASGDPHVSVKQWAGQSGGSTVYFNELRWSDRPCTQCAQTFVLETGRGGVPATSDTETIRTRLCTTLDPNNPPGGE